MKKGVALIVILLCAGAALSAQSIGVGFLYDLSVDNGIKTEGDGFVETMGTDITSLGGSIFFDLYYVAIDFSFSRGTLESYAKSNDEDRKTNKDGRTWTALGIGLLGKYPMDMAGITLFPLFGIHYNLVLSLYDHDEKVDLPNGESVAEWYSQLSILAGVGFDIPFTNSLFLRAEALLNLAFPMKFFNDIADSDDSLSTTLGLGPRFKIALGYKF